MFAHGGDGCQGRAIAQLVVQPERTLDPVPFQALWRCAPRRDQTDSAIVVHHERVAIQYLAAWRGRIEENGPPLGVNRCRRGFVIPLRDVCFVVFEFQQHGEIVRGFEQQLPARRPGVRFIAIISCADVFNKGIVVVDESGHPQAQAVGDAPARRAFKPHMVFFGK